MANASSASTSISAIDPMNGQSQFPVKSIIQPPMTGQAYLQHRPRSVVWLLGLVGAMLVGAVPEPLQARDFAASLVKIRAVAADGSQSNGSAVVIATNLLATACHVIREAKTIEVTHGAARWVGTVASGSPTHDLCLINVPHLDLPSVVIRASESLQLGEKVVAAGFPGGHDLAVRDGLVEGLYPYDGGEVIRTSATFDAGASGGGLFDVEGALVGVLAFKACFGAKLHFALPADWALPGSAVSSSLGPVEVSAQRSAFWERPRASQPPFLQSISERSVCWRGNAKSRPCLSGSRFGHASLAMRHGWRTIEQGRHAWACAPTSAEGRVLTM